MPNSFIANIWPCMQLKSLHIQPVLKKYTMDTPTCRIGYATLVGFSFTGFSSPPLAHSEIIEIATR
jgi:hypothetical protein